MFFAFIIAFISAQMHLLAPYLKKEIFPHDFLVIFYFSALAYAIVRHQLMDIEVIIKKTLVFAGLLASVFTMLVLPTLLIQEYILRTAGQTGRLIGLTISGVIIILTMRRIENFLINVTDRYLFQKKYDYKELLKTFTAEVLTVLDLDKLVNLTVDKLVDIIKLSSSAVLLFNEEKQEFRVVASQNVKDTSVTLVRPDGMVAFMGHSATQAKGLTLSGGYSMKQLYWMALGMALLFVVIIVSYQKFIDLSYILYAVNILLLLFVLVVGHIRLGAQRWFSIGAFAFQPSEFIKICLILVLSNYVGSRKGAMEDIKSLIVPCVLLAIPFCLVVQPQSPRNGTRYLAHLQSMRKARPVIIAFVIYKNLSLVFKAPEGR